MVGYKGMHSSPGRKTRERKYRFAVKCQIRLSNASTGPDRVSGDRSGSVDFGQHGYKVGLGGGGCGKHPHHLLGMDKHLQENLKTVATLAVRSGRISAYSHIVLDLALL